MTPSRWARAAVALATGPTLVLSACSTEGPRSTTIEMTSADRFVEATITVKVGSTVTWSNASTDLHTVAASAEDPRARVPEAADGFDSGVVQPGTSFAHTFGSIGTYVFVCELHGDEGMIGAVEVVR